MAEKEGGVAERLEIIHTGGRAAAPRQRAPHVTPEIPEKDNTLDRALENDRRVAAELGARLDRTATQEDLRKGLAALEEAVQARFDELGEAPTGSTVPVEDISSRRKALEELQAQVVELRTRLGEVPTQEEIVQAVELVQALVEDHLDARQEAARAELEALVSGAEKRVLRKAKFVDQKVVGNVRVGHIVYGIGGATGLHAGAYAVNAIAGEALIPTGPLATALAFFGGALGYELFGQTSDDLDDDDEDDLDDDEDDLDDEDEE